MGRGRNKRKTLEDNPDGSDSEEGPKKVFLLRHGQSLMNLTGEDIRDSVLSPNGETQARSWKGHAEKFGVEVILVSPLRRAIQTACMAFQAGDTPMVLCRHARELWWDEQVNTPSDWETMGKFLAEMQQIRKGEIEGVEDALTEQEGEREEDSVSRLVEVLRNRPERSIAVVCHWGVIHGISGASANNCEVVECETRDKGNRNRFLKPVGRHPPPGGPCTI